MSECAPFRGGWVVYLRLLPIRAAFADRERIVKVWSAVVTMAVVLVSPSTPHRPSATAPTHLVLKLTFPEYKKAFKNS